ncbi:MAG: hypothetical protein M3350_06350 [Actinomycetota bacterium]|nr:hypothetical protein [Actinomycetota bacterium]
MAAFVDRVGCAQSHHIESRFGVSERVAQRRLRALRQRGQVRSSRPLSGPALVHPAGAAAPAVRDLVHSLEATAVVVRLELDGFDVITERMMRREEHSGGDRRWSIATPRTSAGGSLITHRPDMAFGTGSSLTAIEVELTRKSNRRLAELMGAWARQARYSEVHYLCRSEALARLVSDHALRAGADLVVRVWPLEHWRAG